MEFSADFTSIHVVSNIFFEDFEPNVLFSISMSDLRDKNRRYGSVLTKTALFKKT